MDSGPEAAHWLQKAWATALGTEDTLSLICSASLFPLPPTLQDALGAASLGLREIIKCDLQSGLHTSDSQSLLCSAVMNGWTTKMEEEKEEEEERKHLGAH